MKLEKKKKRTIWGIIIFIILAFGSCSVIEDEEKEAKVKVKKKAEEDHKKLKKKHKERLKRKRKEWTKKYR